MIQKYLNYCYQNLVHYRIYYIYLYYCLKQHKFHLLNEENIPSDKIDRGFEFNGWYNYNDVDFDAGLKNLWVHDVDYIIAFEKLPGTNVVYESSYSRWLHFEKSTIKVLKKNDSFEEMKSLFYTDNENFEN